LHSCSNADTELGHPTEEHMRVVRNLAVAAALALTATALVGAPAQSADPVNYVAMGDSFSAGTGIWPSDSSANPACLRSANDIGHLLAPQIGAQLTDVACGGAKTGDFAGKQYGFIAPQLNALSADTDVVTMTIGGNDNDVFVSMIMACASASALTWGFGSPCKSIYGNTFKNKIANQTYPALVSALQATKAKAPNAKIGIAGYLTVLPATWNSGCWDSGIARGDVPYIFDIQNYINATVKRAAAAAGVTYVDVSESLTHDACRPAGQRWTASITSFEAAPAHPNLAGSQAYARMFKAQLGL
jgi:lysophospholipase L1-like esterase